MEITALVVVVILLLVATLVFWARRSDDRGPGTGLAYRIPKAAGSLGAALRGAWGDGIDSTTWSALEDALIGADVGVDSAADIVAGVRAGGPDSASAAREMLADQLRSTLEGPDRTLRLHGRPSVILVVGVNGTGKTTTIAKLASKLTDEGKKVVLAAADTFRAAAGDQLRMLGDRVGAVVVGGQEGGDPAAVAYDAIESARSRSADVVVVDTAGRLHGKKNLMAELSKIHRVAAGDREAVDEVLLVLDATGGQNGLAQVEEFIKAVPVTGIVLTKLDGTARGGIVFAVERQLGIPVKYVGLGEGMDDLEPFDPNRFVSELLEES